LRADPVHRRALSTAMTLTAGDNFMTCDYSYTTQAKIFFEEHADLNLNP
jgi:hypothetical protein